MQYTNRQILKITFPVLASLLLEQMVGLTDTAYLGRVGEAELGASALAGVYYMAIYMLGFGFSMGAQVLMARRNGEGNYRRIGGIFRQGTLFLLAFAALLFFCSRAYSPLLLRGLIESDAVFRAAVDYIDWRVYGFFFSFVSAMYRAFYMGTTRTKILTASSLAMVGTNVLLNYILIFGKCGLPALGIKGAAMASSLSEAVSMLFFVIHSLACTDYKKYGLYGRRGFDFRVFRQIMRVSVWFTLQYGIAFFGWFVFFVAVEHHGERPLAISNVVRSISSFLFIFVNAFASTNSSLVSNLIGAGETERVMPLCRQMIRLCYAFVLPLILLMAAFPTLALRIYTDDTALVAGAVTSLWVLLSSYLIAVPAFIYFMSVSGTGNTGVAFRLDMATMFVYILYVIWIVVIRKAGVAACWTTEHVYNLMLLTSYFYLSKGNWRNKKI